jgi:hypothetical protein
MAGKASVLDRYRQYAILSGTLQSGAGAGMELVTQMVTGITNIQKIAWEVTRFEYWLPTLALKLMDVADEVIRVGITASSSILQGLNPTNAALYDMLSYVVVSTAAAATPIEGIVETPIVHDYGDMPMLMLPQNLYMVTYFNSTAAAGPYTAWCRLWYKEVELGPEDWYDLLQMRMPLGATS